MWLAFSWDMGIEGLWIGLTVSLVYCALFSTLLCVRTDWDREVWKVMQRLEEQHKTRRMEIESDEERRVDQVFESRT